MKHVSKAIGISALMILFAVSAFAQSNSQAVVKIPFMFAVGENLFPAGEYNIEPRRRDSATVWTITNLESGQSAAVITQSVRSTRTVENAKLVFHQYDDLYFLSQIWLPGTNTGRELRISDQEKSMENSLAAMQQEYVLTAGSR